MTHREYWFWLCSITGIGSVSLRALLERYGTPEALWELSAEEVNGLSQLNDAQKRAFQESREEYAVRKRFDRMTMAGIEFVTLEEENYPKRILQLYDPPGGLFYKGQLPPDSLRSTAIVGARNCSPYGREVSRAFAKALAAAGIGIVSGLARGVDGYAHEGALSAGGRTYGVLGCGVDICYPRQNLELYLEMQANGGVLSEQPPGIQPIPRHFPMRNRLIAALSDAILIVEAREKSGSLITVDQGLELGREIFAVPGRINDSLSQGCNELIRHGATIARSPADLLSYPTGQDFGETEEKALKLPLDSSEKLVYACLDLVPKNIQGIVNQVQLLPPVVMELLDSLELKGLIREVSRGYYIKTGL
ncbi:MAG: DNA-processing protein DprA [Lachnospiraceae bacterium]|nr:DNA-processing protein DprA [Lachnospiraceae bacterium]